MDAAAAELQEIDQPALKLFRIDGLLFADDGLSSKRGRPVCHTGGAVIFPYEDPVTVFAFEDIQALPVC